jgi:hypothetical protein
MEIAGEVMGTDGYYEESEFDKYITKYNPWNFPKDQPRPVIEETCTITPQDITGFCFSMEAMLEPLLLEFTDGKVESLQSKCRLANDDDYERFWMANGNELKFPLDRIQFLEYFAYHFYPEFRYYAYFRYNTDTEEEEVFVIPNFTPQPLTSQVYSSVKQLKYVD